MTDNYFDVVDYFFNEVVGDIWISIFLGLILIVLACIKARMPYQLTLLFSLLWIEVCFAFTGILILWAFAVLTAAGIAYYMFSKALER